ncbi:MAG: RNA 2',3'-cyclic phosphodiesterase [Thaumarchaeota archaeon]|nr:RNA 2',3'-cyclic phosphodiesterase [Nitrososphaerota archaeon]
MRTFVAVEISNESTLNAIAKLQSELKIKAKPVSKENMHFTLLFLGEISDDMAPKIMESLSSVSFNPIEMKLIDVGAFPNPRSPRVVWIGVDKNAAKNLVELAVQVEEKLRPLGFRSDKPFKPHLTIFRIKDRMNDISHELNKFRSVEIGHETISELKFKKSILTPTGPIYSDLQVVKAKQ